MCEVLLGNSPQFGSFFATMQKANESKNGRVIDAPLKIYMETKDHLIQKGQSSSIHLHF